MRHTRSFAVRSVLRLAATLAAATSCTVPPPSDQYMVAYTDSSSRARVRYLDSEGNWKDGRFPEVSSPYGAGVGFAAAGWLRGVGSATDSSIQLWFGIGPESWGDHSAAETDQRPASGPAVTYDSQGNVWWVAYRTRTNTVALYQYKSPSFAPINFAPTAQNDGVDSRPGVACGANRLVLAWLREEKIYVAASGTSTPIPAWVTAPLALPEVPLAGKRFGSAKNAVALTHDGTHFVLGLLRGRSCAAADGQDCLKGDYLFLYRSVDGTTWSLWKYNANVLLASRSLGLAIRDGKILVAIGSETAEAVYFGEGPPWTDVNKSRS
jgi:hypothetical protein